MRYFLFTILPLFICSCASQPNPVVQKLELTNLRLAAVLSQHVPALSAHQHEDVTKTIKDEEHKSTITISTQYVEPFQGCARYNTSYNQVITGFFGSNRNYNFIFNVCEKEQEQTFGIELLAPDVPGVTGIKDEIDISKIKKDEPSNS